MNLLVDPAGKLRNGWWIGIFFLLMAVILVPMVVVSGGGSGTVSIGAQAAIVAVASGICQLLRRARLTDLTGRFDLRWVADSLVGLALGGALMLVPAAFLAVTGFVTWKLAPFDRSILFEAVPLVAAAALTEELLFRGFMFQRLIDGIGPLLAQLLVAGYFVLTHSSGLGSAGELRGLASVNIFIASLLFGLAFLRTRSLALPLGLHFGANFAQGTILGFGVSGTSAAGLLVPLTNGPAWMTGGSFGLEASLPGLLSVAAAVWIAFRWKGHARSAAPPAAEPITLPAAMEQQR